MKRYAGRILMSEKVLLEWLDFKGGRIHYLGYCPEYDKISISIEHPDMPEIKEADMLPIVDPMYALPLGDRIDPPKHNPLMRLLRKFL